MRASLLLAALCLTACDQLMYLEAEVPELCQTLTGQQFTIPPELRAQYALLPPALTSAYELGKSFDFDVQVPPELANLQTRFSLTRVRITAVAPTTDLGFIESAEVTMEAPTDATLPPYTVRYQRVAPAMTEVTWNGSGFDLGPYVRTGTLRFTVALVGALPDADVHADLEICASAAVKFNYLQR